MKVLWQPTPADKFDQGFRASVKKIITGSGFVDSPSAPLLDPYIDWMMEQKGRTLDQRRRDAVEFFKSRRWPAQHYPGAFEASAHSIALEITRWLDAPLVMEKPTGSRLHHLEQAIADQNALSPDLFDVLGQAKVLGFKDEEKTIWSNLQQVVVLQHDWAGALAASDDVAHGEINLPYADMAFEARVSGHHVIAFVEQREGEPFILWPAIEVSGGIWATDAPKWAYEGTSCYPFVDDGTDMVNGVILRRKRLATKFGVEKLAMLLFRQVRAAVISLEAEVVKTSAVRAPHKLNRARERRGRAPMIDYHVLQLSRRPKALPAPVRASDAQRNSPRLHFRRGHWRHFDNSKTWIKWTLVGDPDLGFVEKEYRL